MSGKKEQGQLAERVAATRLEQQGYKVLETNYRCPFGEIDIVASEGDDLVFVEVRSRTGRAAGLPEESVNPRKREHLRRAAESYLQSHPEWDFRCRVDVVAIDMSPSGSPVRIEVIKNAVTW